MHYALGTRNENPRICLFEQIAAFFSEEYIIFHVALNG